MNATRWLSGEMSARSPKCVSISMFERQVIERVARLSSILRLRREKRQAQPENDHDFHPPAIAPTTSNGSAPLTTASGSSVSGGSCEKSSSQAKNRTNGAALVSVVVANGPAQHRVPRLERVEHGRECRAALDLDDTSSSTRASVRRCAGSTTRITASAPRRTARRADRGRWRATGLRRSETRRPGLQSCRSTPRTDRAGPPPSRSAAR